MTGTHYRARPCVLAGHSLKGETETMQRPEGFPQSIVLCGVRDIQDYSIRSSSGEMIAGGSPFNVAAKSLRLGASAESERAGTRRTLDRWKGRLGWRLE